ncbi:MAG: DUF58 domain-containing protein [Lachnospira sp.]|nr:DUF58 domain-containing protein [Lachnospira sp.]
MTKYRILHILIFVLMVIAYIFIENPYIPAILLTYILMMLVDGIIFFVIRLKVKASIRYRDYMIVRGDAIRLYLDVCNNSVFPIPNCKIKLKYKYEEDNKYTKTDANFFLRGKEKKTIDLDIECKHCGHVIVKVLAVTIEDYFAFFAKKFKKFKVHRVMVAPQPNIVENVSVVKNDAEMIDSDEFSANKPGNDPLEIFGIRQYQEGDRINRIHWKLTMKMQEYIVKEFSLPIKTTDVILIEQCESNKDNMDEVYEAAMSISLFLNSIELIHNVGYYDMISGNIFLERVEKTEQFTTTISEAYKAKKYKEPVVLDVYNDVVEDRNKGNIYYITTKIDESQLDLLAELCRKVEVYLIYIGDKNEKNTLLDKFEAVGVKLDSMERIL